MVLDHDFYQKTTQEIAQALLGKLLVHNSRDGITIGRIVETEAYISDDPASHAFRGITKRNAPMFGMPGTSYVYLIYGKYHCFNVVTGPVGSGEAVLIRALEPIEGIRLMRMRRDIFDLSRLCSGPGRLTQAMGVGMEVNTHSLTTGFLTLQSDRADQTTAWPIAVSPRIGVTAGKDLLLRYSILDNPFVSRPCVPL